MGSCITSLLNRKTNPKQEPTKTSSSYHCEENMLIFTPLKFCILSTSSTFCGPRNVKATCPSLFGRKDVKPEPALWQRPYQKHTGRQRKIQTRLALFSSPEFAIGEAYEKSTWLNPKKSSWELWRHHTPQRVLTLVLLDVARGSLYREEDCWGRKTK